MRVSDRTGQCRGLACLPGIGVYEVRCLADNRDWAATAMAAGHRIVITRSGGYLRRVNATTTFVDATNLLVTEPNDDISVAHPLGPGDVFTAIELDDRRAAWLAEDGSAFLPGELTIDDALDLAHRSLVSACRRGIDDLETGERLHRLLAALPTAPHGRAAKDRRRPATVVAHRRLVNQVREVLAEGDFAGGLDEIAAAVSTSPHHLSRVFRAVAGETITAYRNRLRVRAVLTDLQDGEGNLRGLAARYGFADQAHLTRVVRRHLGLAPSTVRRMFEPGTNVQRPGDRISAV
jgi:AraC-like DNA-binding protein